MPGYGGYIGFSRSVSSLAASGVWPLRDAERAARDKRWTSDDPYYSNTVALYRISDISSPTFVDESASAGTVTAGTNVTKSSTQSKSGGVSALCNGTVNAGLSQTVADNRFLLSSSDWTIEAWIYPLTIHSGHVFIVSNSAFTAVGLQTRVTSGGAIQCNNASTAAFEGGSYSANAWQHLAVSRQSGTVRIFLNGTLLGSTTQTPGANGSGFRVGGTATNFGNLGFNGYIDDVRFTQNVARYTANFTPPGAL